MAVPTVEITGDVVAGDGVGLVTGTIVADLSQPASAPDGSRVVARVVGTITNGVVASLELAPNDVLSPAGTHWRVVISGTTADGQIYRSAVPEKWQLASSPTSIKIGAVPRLSVVPGVALGLPNATATAAGAVTLANDLGGTAALPTVVATHLSSPLPEAQGGSGAASLSAATVLATGSTTARTLAARFGDVLSIRDFGGVGDWNGATGTDNTAAIDAAHARLLARGGGTLYFPSGKYLVSGQIKLPTSGVTIAGGEGPFQRQPPIKWLGEGDLRDGFQPNPSTAPYAGSMLVMTYNGGAPAVAKVETYGAGHFTVEGLTFWDPSGGTLPFILTTNTNVTIRDNGFFGSKTGVLADQDAIIVGGQDTNPATVNDPNMAFHGFTSEIANNFFGYIRRGVLAKQWVASLYIHGNFFSHTTGTNLADGAAVEFAPGVNGSTGACQIVNNRFNMPGGYTYSIKLAKTSHCFISGNDVEDAQHVNNTAVVYFDADSSGNLALLTAVPTGMIGFVDDNGVNTIIQATPTAGAQSVIPYGEWIFKGTSTRLENGNTAIPYGHFVKIDTGEEAWVRMLYGGAAIGHFWAVKVGGATENLGYFKRDAAGTNTFALYGATKAQIEAIDGDLTLKAKTGSVIRLGSTSAPSERFGTGAPNTDDAVGSTYRRTDAAPYFYIKRGGGTGAWSPPVIPALVSITYAATMDIDAAAGTMFKIVVSDANAYSFNAPTGGVAGQRITVQIKATTTIHAGSPFPSGNAWRAAAWTAPTSGNCYAIEFAYDGSFWYQSGAAVLVAN